MTKDAAPVVSATSDVFRFDPGLLDALRDAGFEPRSCEQVRPSSTEYEIVAALDRAWAVIAGVERYSAKVIESCPDLRAIARPGVGYDSVDLAAATRAGVAVCVTPGANTVAVADMTLTLMLAATRQLIALDASTRRGDWRPPQVGRELSSCAVGLIGLGGIGSLVAQRLTGFGCRVLGFDPAATSPSGVELVTLDELLTTADVISLHLPLLDSTRHLLGSAQFAKMRPGAVVINTSRGALIDEAALLDALESGRISAVALDVFEAEPLRSGAPLLQVPGLTLTPHIGGFTQESVLQMGRASIQNLVDVREGVVSANRINPPRHEAPASDETFHERERTDDDVHC